MPTAGQFAKWTTANNIQGVSAATALSDLGAQPLDADLTAIAALAGTNTIYYRSGANTWSPVVVSTGLAFLGGNLTASGGGGNVSNSGTPAANDVAQWVTSTTIKGVALATWRTDPHFFNILDVKSAAGGDGAALRGLAGQGWVYATGASADISLVLSSQGNGVISFYNGGFGRLCAQFTSAPTGNTFPTFTGNVNFSTLGNNPTGNPIIMTSVMKLLGVTDGSSPGAGEVGEVLEVSATSVSVPNGVATNITSLVLPAGDWDVRGTILFTGGAAAHTQIGASLSTASGATQGTPITTYQVLSAPTNPVTLNPYRRVLASTSTTIYLVAQVIVTATLGCSGQIIARRMR